MPDWCNGLENMRFKFCVVSLSLLFTTLVSADGLVDGSSEAGAAKAIVCGACHGPGGNSVNPAWPSIAGQHAAYIVQQLKAFKSGARSNILMSSQAMLLTEDDILNLAAYYASQPTAAKSVSDPQTITKGEAIYRGGNKKNGVSACLACHGPTGNGNPAAKYPAISGQYAVYTAQTLRDYASGSRKSDAPTKIMRDIASNLTEDEIQAVASYVQGLH